MVIAMAEIWDQYHRFGAEDRSGMPEAHQQVFAILDWRQEMASGGFDAYFRYWGGNTAQMALTALPGSLGVDWATLLREAMALFGAAYPTDPDARAELIDDLDLDAALEALDERFAALEARDDADAMLALVFE